VIGCSALQPVHPLFLPDRNWFSPCSFLGFTSPAAVLSIRRTMMHSVISFRFSPLVLLSSRSFAAQCCWSSSSLYKNHRLYLFLRIWFSSASATHSPSEISPFRHCALPPHLTFVAVEFWKILTPRISSSFLYRLFSRLGFVNPYMPFPLLTCCPQLFSFCRSSFLWRPVLHGGYSRVPLLFLLFDPFFPLPKVY